MISTLRVPCVAVIITNSAGQVLLNLRDNRPNLPFPNRWTLPGGRVEAGETPMMRRIENYARKPG